MIRLLIREEDKQGLAYMLGSIGPDAKPAVHELLKLLDHEDRIVRVTAAYALWNIDGQFDVALPVFLEALRSGDPYPAVTFLGEIGPAAKAAAPELAKLLDDNDAGVRTATAKALKKIDPEEAAKHIVQ